MFEVKNFNNLLGNVDGISDNQLEAHFGLYAGYVKKLNEITEKLQNVDKSLSNYSFGEFSELKRREAIAFNGVFLHEKYFENLGSSGNASEKLKQMINDSFGSWENFELDLKSSAVSTPGWVVLTLNKQTNKLHTYIMYEHHIGLPVDQEIILALDCWEHAFMIDYGTKKVNYLNAFLLNINWDIVNGRLDKLF
ncbi:hypothetical protein HOC99_02535 [Candidatus Woesearchaeota archaeon]|jgi:superoxide dismutase, Fe-Mn family|nr:hypothetical protein [Candidatus Woesearchaeota archaeon]MBT4387409.1 hypothetical protein [Candidatus Woesearchaeota archaeon]MBT4595786.1 hypothetical protein [Candidatus Woesearchaeota archaeon]MBT5741365.1 hypothetical protein [Candidatus Woesearchaeota archaeon]MBT7848862.1 hypothetical protein [Candidatus Woesearchaeota archaeon]